jgi:hypothetical protein
MLRTQGLATLSALSAHADPGEPLSAPNTLGIRPSELSSFSVVDFFLSKKSLRSCAFLQNLQPYDVHAKNLVPALQRLKPTEKAVLLTAPQRVRLGRSRMLSWALRPPRLAPTTYPWKKRLPSSIPLSYLKPDPLTKTSPRYLRGVRHALSGLSQKPLSRMTFRAPTYMAFSTIDLSILLGESILRGIFFLL